MTSYTHRRVQTGNDMWQWWPHARTANNLQPVCSVCVCVCVVVLQFYATTTKAVVVVVTQHAVRRRRYI